MAYSDTDALHPGGLERRFFGMTPTNYEMTKVDGAPVLRSLADNSALPLAPCTDALMNAGL